MPPVKQLCHKANWALQGVPEKSARLKKQTSRIAARSAFGGYLTYSTCIVGTLMREMSESFWVIGSNVTADRKRNNEGEQTRR